MRALATLGNVNVDLIIGPTAPWPQLGTEVLVAHDDLRPGGAAGNAALAWAGLGVPFLVASNVGDDALGRWLSDAFIPHSSRWSTSATSTTISVGLTHPDDERTVFTTRGHLPALSWDEARAQLDVLGGERLDGGLLLLCGSFLTDRLTADYPAIFAWARARGVEVALDPGWPVAGWTEAEKARVASWLACTQHLLVNEVEATAMSGRDGVADAMLVLAAVMPHDATVVVKSGPGGANGWRAGAVAHATAPAVQVIDTIGAGDIFNAGYLLAVAEGGALPDSMAAGVALASKAISTSPRAYERSFAGVSA